MNDMKYIGIELLEHHPKNPREEIGDISELAESIKTNGIMQNLTVVPHEDKYWVVIGNRRLEAAKAAGLDELPCVISDMDEATQQSTMLLENMQRCDLTLYEQAQGFQMCLDLGMNEDELKEKTGFSKQTIKHRLKLLNLDKDKLKKATERGGTIQDYINLEKIEDVKEKNRLLGFIGTDNFRYRLNIALRSQKEKKALDALLEKLREVMPECTGDIPSDYIYEEFISGNYLETYKIPDDVEDVKYMFKRSQRTIAITIYKEKAEGENCVQAQPEQEELDAEEIKKKAQAAFEARMAFAKEKYHTLMMDIKGSMEIKYAFSLITSEIDHFYQYPELYKKITGNEAKDEKVFEHQDSIRLTQMVRMTFALIYAHLDTDNPKATLCPWSKYENQYYDDRKKKFEVLYRFLEYYGYRASEEEKAIMFGTHELYYHEGE